MKKTLFILASLAAALLLPARSIAASTDWQDLGGGKARLIATKNPENGKLEGIVEIRLNAGWKTYWRSPGSSGIAPEFDFSRSNNADIENIRFPEPDWIVLPGASFYGYKGNLAFSFSGLADTPSSAIDLNLLIGVCEEICIPATAEFVLGPDQLNRSDPKSALAIALAKAKLPSPASNTLRVKHALLEKNQLDLHGVGEPNSEIRLVVHVENGWVSDPITIDKWDGKRFNLAVDLPNHAFKHLQEATHVNYALIQHKGPDGEIHTIVEDSIPLSGSSK